MHCRQLGSDHHSVHYSPPLVLVKPLAPYTHLVPSGNSFSKILAGPVFWRKKV